MKKFKISMEGNVNGIETTFSLQINLTEKQIQQYVVQQALLEAEHKGFEDIKILSVEEESAPEYVQMKLFPDEENVTENEQTEAYQKYGNSSNTVDDFSEDDFEEPSEEDTQDDENCCEDEDCCEDNITSASEYVPYNSAETNQNVAPSYTAYAPNQTTTTPPKSYHVKLGNDYAPYRSYRINISTTKDIT